MNSIRFVSFGIAATVASTASLLCAPTGHAAPAPAPTAVVHYADLNLLQPSDAHVLYGRLQRAAAQVCGWVDMNNLSAYSRWQGCYHQALERAVEAIKAPELL